VIERALILDPEHGLENVDLLPAPVAPAGGEDVEPGRELNLRSALLRLEKEMLIEAQRRAGGVRKEAARLHNKRTAAYLLGDPMLGDHLEEGLEIFGISSEGM